MGRRLAARPAGPRWADRRTAAHREAPKRGGVGRESRLEGRGGMPPRAACSQTRGAFRSRTGQRPVRRAEPPERTRERTVPRRARGPSQAGSTRAFPWCELSSAPSSRLGVGSPPAAGRSLPTLLHCTRWISRCTGGPWGTPRSVPSPVDREERPGGRSTLPRTPVRAGR